MPETVRRSMTVTKLRMTALAPTTKRGFVVGILASLKECRTNIIGAISLGRNQFLKGRKPDSSHRLREVRIHFPPAESQQTSGSSAVEPSRGFDNARARVALVWCGRSQFVQIP